MKRVGSEEVGGGENTSSEDMEPSFTLGTKVGEGKEEGGETKDE